MAVSGQTAAQAVPDPARGEGGAGPTLAHGAGLEVAAATARTSGTRPRPDGCPFMKNVGTPPL